jgi:hypothetical protein
VADLKSDGASGDKMDEKIETSAVEVAPVRVGAQCAHSFDTQTM